MRRLLPCLLALLAVASCASGGGARADAAGRPLRVTLLVDGQGRFEILSRSHTEAVELYSTPRADAGRKVQTDEVVAALVEHLGELGLERYARAGGAPDRDGTVARAFEVEEAGAVRSWPIGAGTPADERRAFATAMRDFLDLYNLTQGLQSVENAEGPAYFHDRDGR